MRLNHPGSQLLTLLVVIASLTLGFHGIGSNPTFAFEWSLTWFDQADPETALAAVLRVTGLLCCYWMLITTVLYALLRSGGRAPQTVRWMTIPAIRRIVDRALVTTLAISALAVPPHPPAAAENPDPVIGLEIHGDGIPVPHLRLEPATRPATPADPTSGPAAAAEALRGSYTVSAGDNLWLIAETRLRAATGSAPTEQMIAAYWRKLIDANIASLRSGDPNLIYAGEIVTLPQLEVRP